MIGIAEHGEEFFKMIRSIFSIKEMTCMALSFNQIDKMENVREFNYGCYQTKWVYNEKKNTLYFTLPFLILAEIFPCRCEIIPLLDPDPEHFSEKALWSKVIGKINRYAETGEI